MKDILGEILKQLSDALSANGLSDFDTKEEPEVKTSILIAKPKEELESDKLFPEMEEEEEYDDEDSLSKFLDSEEEDEDPKKLKMASSIKALFGGK